MALPVLAAGALWAGLLAFLKKAIPSVTYTVMKALGIGFLTFTGFEVVWETAKNIVYAKYNGLPVTMLQLLDLAGVDSALGMIFATVAGIMAFKLYAQATRFAWSKGIIS